jgi:hypothetical protein
MVRQAERADFSKLMICQIFSTDVKKTLGGSELYNCTILKQFRKNWYKFEQFPNPLSVKQLNR